MDALNSGGCLREEALKREKEEKETGGSSKKAKTCRDSDLAVDSATPSISRRNKSRWDETPTTIPEDYQYFGALLQNEEEEDEEKLSPEKQKELKIMKLLLMVKNGTPPERKTALIELTDKTREFIAGPLFNNALKVVNQCVSTDGVEADYIRNDILPEFFRKFWVRRMALDMRNYRQLVDTTVEIANKAGVGDVLGRLVEYLKDDSEQYRRMVMETIGKVVAKLGVSAIDARLEELLVDGILYASQEQTSYDDNVMLNGFAAVVNALGERIKPYLHQIYGTINWRLSNRRSPKVRQQAADLVSMIAVVMNQCHEEQLMARLGVLLYEHLGDMEHPDFQGSILGALKAIVDLIGMTLMTPAMKENLLPRLTFILKIRHERVKENCIDLVGRIADREAEFVPPREWMRICFQLLEMLQSHNNGIQRATVNTFGYISKAIGPQHVLATLLNNLMVQDHRNQVCTTVAIAIVARMIQS